jgi:hypothetical protein
MNAEEIAALLQRNQTKALRSSAAINIESTLKMHKLDETTHGQPRKPDKVRIR